MKTSKKCQIAVKYLKQEGRTAMVGRFSRTFSSSQVSLSPKKLVHVLTKLSSLLKCWRLIFSPVLLRFFRLKFTIAWTIFELNMSSRLTSSKRCQVSYSLQSSPLCLKSTIIERVGLRDMKPFWEITHCSLMPIVAKSPSRSSY